MTRRERNTVIVVVAIVAFAALLAMIYTTWSRRVDDVAERCAKIGAVSYDTGRSFFCVKPDGRLYVVPPARP